MGTYIREVEDENGDLLDVYAFCSQGCYRDSFAEDRIGDKATEGGAWPCYDGGGESDIHCAECGVLIASPDKETPVVVNLISRPPIDTLI